MKYTATKRTALSLGVAGAAVILLLLAVTVLAAGERLPRSLVGSGGGPVGAGGINLHSAIGQPVVGTVSTTGNTLSLCSGYLCGPGTPDSSGDTTPPMVDLTNPGDGESDIPLNQPVSVFFSEALDTASVTYSITPTVPGLIEVWTGDDTRLTLSHDPFSTGTQYTVTIHTGSDPTGNPLSNAPYTWSFTTGSSSAEEADLALQKDRIGTGTIRAGERITYTFTITNNGPTTPITATLVDTFSDANALEAVLGDGCVWAPGSIAVTCTLTNVTISESSQLTLTITTREDYLGTLSNNAVVAPSGSIVDPVPTNDTAGPVSVQVVQAAGEDEHRVFLPLAIK